MCTTKTASTADEQQARRVSMVTLRMSSKMTPSGQWCRITLRAASLFSMAMYKAGFKPNKKAA